jgi:NADH-quinone oxidoreductase subunit E
VSADEPKLPGSDVPQTPGGSAPGTPAGTPRAAEAETVAPPFSVSDAGMAVMRREIAKYPPEQKASAVIACLAVVQDERGWVSDESEAFVAKLLDMPEIAVHEVTTFYNMFNQQPMGRFKLNVCTNLPCQLRDGQTALEHLCTRLGVEEGGTTADGLFTVQKSECLGACADAPVMLVNDRQMCSYMTPERLDELVAMLASHAVIERAA